MCRKIAGKILCSLLLLIGAGSSGNLTLNLHVSIFRHPGGTSSTMVGVRADYRFHPHFSIRGEAAHTTWDSHRMLPISASLLGHVPISQGIDFYGGAGPAFTFYWRPEGDEYTLGAHALAGTALTLLPDVTTHFEVRYFLRDVRNLDTGGFTFGGGLGGGLTIRI